MVGEKLRIMDKKQLRIQVLEGLVQKYTHVTYNLKLSEVLIGLSMAVRVTEFWMWGPRRESVA